MAGKTDGAASGCDVADLSIEQVREELNVIKDRLEAGGEPPEKEFWQRADALSERGQTLLHEYRTGYEALLAGEQDASNADDADVAGLTFKQAREELDLINQRMEVGGVPLQEAFALLKREESLAAHCRLLWDGFARATAPAAVGATS